MNNEQEIVPGLLVKRNKENHRVIRLHYSADPNKRIGTPWFDKMSRRYVNGTNSLDWRREYEIDFKAGSGELVFPQFPELERDIVVDPFELDDTFRFYAGLDWGNRNPVSFHVYAESVDKVFFSVWEYYEKGNETNVFEVSRMMREVCPFYDKLEWIAYDPQMNAENQQRKDGNTSIARMFFEEVPEDIKVEKLMAAHGRSDMLAVQMTQVLLNERRLRFFKTCPRQIDEFRNLKHPPRVETKNEPEKLLDKDNHSWDDWKYMILSHPSSKTISQGPAYNTVAYYNRVTSLAEDIAAQTGQDVQSVFSSLYGKSL